jgi:hypothetical protein
MAPCTHDGHLCVRVALPRRTGHGIVTVHAGGRGGVTGAGSVPPTAARGNLTSLTRSMSHWSQEHHAPTLRTLRSHNSVDTRQQSGHRVCKVARCLELLAAKPGKAGGAYGEDCHRRPREPLQAMPYRLIYPFHQSRVAILGQINCGNGRAHTKLRAVAPVTAARPGQIRGIFTIPNVLPAGLTRGNRDTGHGGRK